MKSDHNCFRGTRFFIPLTSSDLGSLCREIVGYGGINAPDPILEDLCNAPHDSGFHRGREVGTRAP